jgi:hypothetical protein
MSREESKLTLDTYLWGTILGMELVDGKITFRLSSYTIKRILDSVKWELICCGYLPEDGSVYTATKDMITDVLASPKCIVMWEVGDKVRLTADWEVRYMLGDEGVIIQSIY